MFTEVFTQIQRSGRADTCSAVECGKRTRRCSQRSVTLSVGTSVSADDFRIIKVDHEALLPNAPRKRSEMIEHSLIAPIPKGDFILLTELSPDVKH